MNTSLLLEHFPELQRTGLKRTYQKQWDKFLIAFAELNVWVHYYPSRHSSGEGIVLYPKWWKKHFKNHERFHYDLMKTLSPYITTDNKFSRLQETSRCWVASEDFLVRSKNFIQSIIHDASTPDWIVGVFDRPVSKSIPSQIVSEATWDNVVDKAEVQDQVSLLLSKKELSNGSLSYTEADTGRLHHPAQQIKRETRTALFDGAYSYDIVACAPTILLQEFHKHSNTELNVIDDYISDPSYFRHKISQDTSLQLSDIKHAITSLFYAVIIPSPAQINLSLSNKDIQFSLLKSLGPDKMTTLSHNKTFSSLMKEVKVLFELLNQSIKSDSIRQDDGTWSFTNKAGKTKSISRWNARRMIAHLYFGYERIVIDKMRDQFERYLLIHDGLISYEDVSTDKIEQIIFLETGFVVKIKKEEMKR